MSAAMIAKPLRLLYDCAAHKGDALGIAAAQALLRTRDWHKIVIASDIPELLIPCQYAEQLRGHGLFRLPFDEVVVQYGPGNIHRNLCGSMPARFHELLDQAGERRADEILYRNHPAKT
jgi:hypothetical protein